MRGSRMALAEELLPAVLLTVAVTAAAVVSGDESGEPVRGGGGREPIEPVI